MGRVQSKTDKDLPVQVRLDVRQLLLGNICILKNMFFIIFSLPGHHLEKAKEFTIRIYPDPANIKRKLSLFRGGEGMYQGKKIIRQFVGHCKN